MSDNDLIRRGDVLKVWTDGAINGRTYDEIRIALDKIPAVPQEMSAREYETARIRMYKFPDETPYIAWENAMARGAVDEAVAIVENWSREHPEAKEE